jgi:phosphopantothenoylcysteine decarboxylase/phosphopantothenate--cysteine ligase
LIAVNDVSLKGAGFDVDTNIVTLIDRDEQLVNYPLMKKEEVANIILDKIRQIQHKQQS